MTVAEPFMLGWEEWLALPDLDLPAIKAKVDTGARTSALHAFMVEPIGAPDRPRVRFGVHPIPGRDDVAVYCIADVVDRREVASSNGEREMRYVIQTRVAMGGRAWPIELTLANRESMAYRMLLGRQAIQDDMLVDPQSSFRQPRLGYRVYGAGVRRGEEPGPLHVAILTRRPENATNRRLARTIERRGGRVTFLDRTRASLLIEAGAPALFVDGKALGDIDAVIVRAGKSLAAFSLAIVRQLEMLGAYALNPADSLACLGDPLAVRQTLARAGVEVPATAVSHAELLKESRADAHVLADSLSGLDRAPRLSFAVVGGRALGAIEREPPTALEPEPAWRRAEEGPGFQAARATAEAAARALGLGLVAVDVALTRGASIVAGVSASPSIALFERLSGAAIVEAVVVHLEQATRGRVAKA